MCVCAHARTHTLTHSFVLRLGSQKEHLVRDRMANTGKEYVQLQKRVAVGVLLPPAGEERV